jgi:hypothetical protein
VRASLGPDKTPLGTDSQKADFRASCVSSGRAAIPTEYAFRVRPPISADGARRHGWLRRPEYSAPTCTRHWPYHRAGDGWRSTAAARALRGRSALPGVGETAVRLTVHGVGSPIAFAPLPPLPPHHRERHCLRERSHRPQDDSGDARPQPFARQRLAAS